MVSEDVGVVAFDGGYALFFLQLVDCRNQIAIAGGSLELLRLGGFCHALAQGFDQIGGAAFEEKLHVADGLGVDLGRRQLQNARTQAAFYVKLKAGTGMGACQVHLARRNQEVAVDQVNDSVR